MSTSARALAVVAAAFLVVATAKGAYANWTAPTSTASSGTDVVAIAVHKDPGALLAPGATQRVTFTADNGGSTSYLVRNVTSVVTVDAAHANNCPATSFAVPVLKSNTSVAAGAIRAALGSTTLTFPDAATDQNGCQGATITVTATSS